MCLLKDLEANFLSGRYATANLQQEALINTTKVNENEMV